MKSRTLGNPTQSGISRQSRLVWAAATILLLIISASAGSVFAQNTVNDGSDSVTETAPPPPSEFESAQATMKTFLESFYTEGGADLDQAASCLDLATLPPSLRNIRGRELAAQLKSVLDRTQLIDLEQISEDPEGPPWVLPVNEDSRIVLAAGENHWWLFTSNTVEALDLMKDEVESHEVVEGVEKTVGIVSKAQWLRSKAPASLRGRTFSLERWQWIGLLLLVIVGAAVGKLTVAILQGPMMLWLRRWAREVDYDLVHKSLKPMSSLAMVLVWWFGISWLGLPLGALRWFATLVEVVLILTASLTAYRLVNVLADVMNKRALQTESRYDDLLVPLIRTSLKLLVFVVAFVLLAETFDRNFTGILAGLGIGGLAFALAAKDTIGNLFGSLTVLLDRPFQVGDWVIVGSVEGTVEEVGFRSTRIRTFYNSKITLPNSQLTTASVDNLGDRKYRRWSTRLGLAYNTPPEKIDAFCEGIKELILQHPNTRKDYFHVAFNEFGPAALEILLYVFFVTSDWSEELKERHRLAVDIVRLAKELGVEFAFPTQTLYLRQEQWSPAGGIPGDYPALSQEHQEEARQTARRMTGHLHDNSEGNR